MKNMLILDIVGLFGMLVHLRDTGWVSYLHKQSIILNPRGSGLFFSPITAVYYDKSGIFVHRGSFWHEEICKYFGIPYWEMLEITYAENALSCTGRTYDLELRQNMMRSLGIKQKPKRTRSLPKLNLF